MKTLLEKSEKKQITINLPVDLFERIKLRARKEQRSLSGQIVFLLAGGEPPIKKCILESAVFLPKGGEPPCKNKPQPRNPEPKKPAV